MPLDDGRGNMETRAMQSVLAVGRALQRAGPYVLIEVVLPGGTLIALLLFLYRRGPANVSADLKRLGASALGTLRATLEEWRRVVQIRSGPRLRAARRRERDGLEPLGFAFD
jgi:hypothetical protein